MAGKKQMSRDEIREMAEKAKRGAMVSGSDMRPTATQKRAAADEAAVRSRMSRDTEAVADHEPAGEAYQRMSTHDMMADVPHPMTKKGEMR